MLQIYLRKGNSRSLCDVRRTWNDDFNSEIMWVENSKWDLMRKAKKGKINRIMNEELEWFSEEMRKWRKKTDKYLRLKWTLTTWRGADTGYLSIILQSIKWHDKHLLWKLGIVSINVNTCIIFHSPVPPFAFYQFSFISLGRWNHTTTIIYLCYVDYYFWKFSSLVFHPESEDWRHRWHNEWKEELYIQRQQISMNF